MKYDREAYERLILHSPVFSLDKEKDISAYKREALKLVEYIYTAICSASTRANMSLTVMKLL